MNQKERLLRVLKGEKVDRPPVICPGGMLNACVTETLDHITGNHNTEKEAMIEAAKKVYKLTGFENYGVPYCMTIEAEPLGVKLDVGNKFVEPRVMEYNSNPLEDIMAEYSVVPKEEKRMKMVLEVINELKNDEVPVIGSITGHVSTATSIVDPLMAFKMIRKEPEKLYKFFKYVNDYLIEYAIEMIKAGADVIAISDPTATGEILGSKNFEKFAVPLYKEIISAIHKLNVPVIIHICGNTRAIIDSLNLIGADAISFDSIVNLRDARRRISTRLMGNVNTQLLHTGKREKIISITKNCIDSGTDIVSPACGLSMGTPVDNLKAMTEYVKKGIYE